MSTNCKNQSNSLGKSYASIATIAWKLARENLRNYFFDVRKIEDFPGFFDKV